MVKTTNERVVEPLRGGAFYVRWEQGREIAVVSAVGEIDLADVTRFRAVLDEAVAADTAVIVDMSAVTYMDSSGFNALLETSRIARSLNFPVYLAGCQAGILRLLEVTRLYTMFKMVEGVDAALAAAAEPVKPKTTALVG